jgi:predicted TIM-barrel fold metal-dependent hydrolase
MEKIDVFAHVLPPDFYARMLQVEPTIPQRYAFFNNPVLQSVDERRKHWDGTTRQVISHVNALPEDYVGPDRAAELCWDANEELVQLVRDNRDLFEAAVLMVPMNNVDEAVRIVREQVFPDPDAVGVQVFTRVLGKSIADDEFRPLFDELAAHDVPAWLHPVFDERKPDNNIVFSWEYELTQAMFQMVQTGLFRVHPGLKVIVHHAGAMAPFFAGRIDRILPPEQSADFRRFFADTAILGNTPALELAADFFGVDHMLFGTDAPLGILPAGATKEIGAAIDAMRLSDEEREAIYVRNYQRIVGTHEG